jgi:tRNA1Val (adenine37-N6)-methyltransferase
LQDNIEKKPVILPFGKSIYQTSKGQGICSDTAFLVETVLQEETGQDYRVLDAGSGNGIIAIMLKHYRQSWQMEGIEIQSHLVELANENVIITGEKVKFSRDDIRSYSGGRCYDLIVSNPPFYPAAEGKISPDEERAISRHEIACSLREFVRFIRRNLKDNGRCYLVNLSRREEEIGQLVTAEKMELDKKFEKITFPKGRTSIFRIKK